MKRYAEPKIKLDYDPDFQPAALFNREFLKAVAAGGGGDRVLIAIEREKGQTAVWETRVFEAAAGHDAENNLYIERLVKTILWVKGGWKIYFCGPEPVFDHLQRAYAPGGLREFDASFMSRVYEREFTVLRVAAAAMPGNFEIAEAAGGSLTGCRIGFDAGGSDRKVAAVRDGEVVYSEEVVWHPKLHDDPEYHYREIRAAMQKAASYLPRIDAIGVSSAGIYVANRVMVASLFNKIPRALFDEKVKDIYRNIAAEFGNVPLEVRNDGDVTALAGAMSLHDRGILGIAMGTSEAAGFIDGAGKITGCLNELAFVPVDFNPGAPRDEWSEDYGCGVKYFSQDAVIRLAPAAGISLPPEATPAEKLKRVQDLLQAGAPGARRIFETIGVYLGYAVAYYADFYDIKHLLILGRVTSGEGGSLILTKAREVLRLEFPELEGKFALHLPDESERRVGQAIAAASLPVLKS